MSSGKILPIREHNAFLILLNIILHKGGIRV